MKKLVFILSAFLSFVVAYETQAEIIASGNDCAADDDKSNCYWEIDSTGKLNIIGTGSMKEYTEREWDGPVDHGQSWFQYADFINEVNIQGVSSISTNAFDGFSKINKVTMSDSVESIGRYAFRGSPITTLDLSENISSIERYAFEDNKLTVLEIPDSLKTLIDGIFYSDTLKTVIIPSDIISIGNEIFGSNLENLKDINVICKGENCDAIKEMLKEYKYYSDDINDFETTSVLSAHLIKAKKEQCNSKNYYWNGDECLQESDVTKRKCCSNCQNLSGLCRRVIYTVEEANRVAKPTGNTFRIKYR